MDNPSPQKPYWNPYLAGFGLGLVLLASFMVAGRGLGASGGFASLTAHLSDLIAPAHTRSNPVASAFLTTPGGGLFSEWIVLEVIGLCLGGFVAAFSARRVVSEVAQGSSISIPLRLLAAFSGGVMMGFAARVARGCTSGQALTGSALLSVGGWLFMLSLFAGGYLAARFVRRLWT
ncbi:MAG: YeeE/YedE thiosulfate transporter family protein [bacterium]